MFILRKKTVFYFVLCFSFLFLSGCFPKGRISYIEQFVIDYSLPKQESIVPLNTSIKIERFSIMEIYNNTRMHYKSSPFKLNAYNQSKWRVNPADMLGDFFIRDIINANVAARVISYKEDSDGTFTLEGGIEEFLEIIEDGKSYSLLILNMALIDNRETDLTKKIIFQKRYREKEPIGEHNPESLAKGMSIAFKKISERIIKDIYTNLKQRQ